jgi:SAM-dependent methyltransferase
MTGSGRYLLSVLNNPLVNRCVQKTFRPIELHIREIEGIAEGAGYRMALDVGCGEGLFCRAFASGKYIGYDKDPEKIAYAKGKYRDYCFCSEEMENLGKIDLFLFNNVLHHMKGNEIEDIFGRIARDCRAGTRVIILEVFPAARQRSRVLRMALRIEESLQGSTPREADGWMQCAGRDRFAARTIKEMGGFYLVELELRGKRTGSGLANEPEKQPPVLP